MADAAFVSEELAFVWCLLAVSLIAGFLVLRYGVTALPPAGAAMVVGMLGGGILVGLHIEGDFRFDNGVFFYGLLPPIIYHAGTSVSKTRLWKNLGAILTFALLGTFVSTLVFGSAVYLLMLVGIVRPTTFGDAASAAEAARAAEYLNSGGNAPPAPPHVPGAKPHKGDIALLECFMYGSLVSATDPVSTLAVFSSLGAHPMVHSIVLGESIMNDAVAIVLFRTLEKTHAATVALDLDPSTAGRGDSALGWTAVFTISFSFLTLLLGSVVIGILSSLLVAYALKRMELWRFTARHRASSAIGSSDARAYEMGILLFGAYASYLFAELADLSGITALFFAGIFHSHYAHANVSRLTRESMHVALGTASHIAETFVFAYLGLQIATWKHSDVDLGLLLAALPLCMLARALNIYPLSALVNSRRHAPKRLTGNMQHMLWLAGLRGAVAYALSVKFPALSAAYVSEETPGNPYVESTTLFLIVTTTLIFGGSTAPMLKRFGLLESQMYGFDVEASTGGGDYDDDADGGGGGGGGAARDGYAALAGDASDGRAMVPLAAEVTDHAGGSGSSAARKKTNGGSHGHDGRVEGCAHREHGAQRGYVSHTRARARRDFQGARRGRRGGRRGGRAGRCARGDGVHKRAHSRVLEVS